MWYQNASATEIVGVYLMVSLFIITGIGNVAPAKVKDHVDRAAAAGVPFPALVFWFGIALEFVSSALILSGWRADLGAVGLIVFIVFATAIYLRFWQQQDPMRRNIMRNAFLSNIAIVGGLLVVYAVVS